MLNYLVPASQCNRPHTVVKRRYSQTPRELQIIKSKCSTKFLTFSTIICPKSHSSRNTLILQVVLWTFINIFSHIKLLHLFLTKKKYFITWKALQFSSSLTPSLAKCIIPDISWREHAQCNKACKPYLYKNKIITYYETLGCSEHRHQNTTCFEGPRVCANNLWS